MLLNSAGLEVPQRRIPLRLAYVIGALLEATYKLSRRRDEPPMTRFVAKQLGMDHFFSIEAARRDLNYQPDINREVCLESMRAWMETLVVRHSPKRRR